MLCVQGARKSAESKIQYEDRAAKMLRKYCKDTAIRRITMMLPDILPILPTRINDFWDYPFGKRPLEGKIRGGWVECLFKQGQDTEKYCKITVKVRIVYYKNNAKMR